MFIRGFGYLLLAALLNSSDADNSTESSNITAEAEHSPHRTLGDDAALILGATLSMVGWMGSFIASYFIYRKLIVPQLKSAPTGSASCEYRRPLVDED